MLQIIKKLIRLYQLSLAIEKSKSLLSKSEIRSLIVEVSQSFNVSPALSLRVAQCESNLNPTAIRFNRDGSVDRGLFQWNDVYHPEITDIMAFNPQIATANFCQAVKEGHLGWWRSSQECWRKT